MNSRTGGGVAKVAQKIRGVYARFGELQKYTFYWPYCTNRAEKRMTLVGEISRAISRREIALLASIYRQ